MDSRSSLVRKLNIIPSSPISSLLLTSMLWLKLPFARAFAFLVRVRMGPVMELAIKYPSIEVVKREIKVA